MLKNISKGIAGAVATGIGGIATTYIVVPEGVDMPWWGHVIVALGNAALGFAVVYFAPKNRET